MYSSIITLMKASSSDAQFLLKLNLQNNECCPGKIHLKGTVSRYNYQHTENKKKRYSVDSSQDITTKIKLKE